MEIQKKRKISAIVPAYNEEKKIKGVLDVLVKCPYIDEIICINDGSTDNTLKRIKNFSNIRIINNRKNLGKSQAIVKGIEKAQGEILIFIDADLEGLCNLNIKKLITPLLEDKYDAVIGYYSASNIDELFRPLSGERAYFKKDLVKYLDVIKNEGYGLELKLNYLFRDKKVRVFEMRGVRHVLKHQKQPYNVVAQLLWRESRDLLTQVMKHDNPVEFLYRSYFYPFYLKEPLRVRRRIKKQINKIYLTIKKFQE